MRKSRQFAYAVLAVEIVATAFTIYSIAYSDWDKLSWAWPTAIAIPCCAIAVKAPTTCGVTTQKGHPCPNPTTGILLGCAAEPVAQRVVIEGKVITAGGVSAGIDMALDPGGPRGERGRGPGATVGH